jgi:hypothetical protein
VSVAARARPEQIAATAAGYAAERTAASIGGGETTARQLDQIVRCRVRHCHSPMLGSDRGQVRPNRRPADGAPVEQCSDIGAHGRGGRRVCRAVSVTEEAAESNPEPLVGTLGGLIQRLPDEGGGGCDAWPPAQYRLGECHALSCPGSGCGTLTSRAHARDEGG